MTDIEILTSLLQTTPSVVFLYLFWIERKRSSELSNDRVKLMQECNNKLSDLIDRHFTLVDRINVESLTQVKDAGH